MRARTLSPTQPKQQSDRRDSAHPLAGDALDAATSPTFQSHPEPALIPQPPSPQDSLPPSPADTTVCPTPTTHPYQTLNIHTPCLACQRRRSTLLERLEAEKGAVRFEDWRWKVSDACTHLPPARAAPHVTPLGPSLAQALTTTLPNESRPHHHRAPPHPQIVALPPAQARIPTLEISPAHTAFPRRNADSRIRGVPREEAHRAPDLRGRRLRR
ncbi:hypothetical protein GRF29_77g136985 [Pseudopithomyces chartarum]|uniref:Uncharacterized protein n=1 Tax=Pseudopithomyces chartarum TaxID=1892770 RepID=A0AAN6LZL4_9PLEO|nr:hypothetical protein GRF29_77g136985 [Pseudopithomyces chartarum]